MPVNVSDSAKSKAKLPTKPASENAHKDGERLVLRTVTVRTKKGTFTRRQWVREGDDDHSDNRGSGDPYAYQGTHYPTPEYYDNIKEEGITWEESEHPGVNWLRAQQAIKRHDLDEQLEKDPDGVSGEYSLNIRFLLTHGWDSEKPGTGVQKTKALKTCVLKTDFLVIAKACVDWKMSQNLGVNVFRASQAFVKWAEKHDIEDLLNIVYILVPDKEFDNEE